MIEKIFNVVIEKEEDEKSYFIHCPQLNGLATQGDSVKDALLMFSDALRVYMEYVKDMDESTTKTNVKNRDKFICIEAEEKGEDFVWQVY